MNIAIVGTQWGDEGKGKVVDILTEKCDVVARCQGGANAGHTVIVGDDEYILHFTIEIHWIPPKHIVTPLYRFSNRTKSFQPRSTLPA